jgi:hypothetical protein
MKLLRYLPLIAAACMLSGIAKADPVDFHAVIVDPAGFDVHDLTTTSAIVQFQTCDAGQLPSGISPSFVGCETFENLTGAPLTSLQLEFPDIGAIAGQSVDCTAAAGVPNFFSTATCSVVNGFFVLDYSVGSIPEGFPTGVFTIAESGVPAYDFPEGTLTTTPEPSSVWLLSTGALLLGAFFYSSRRNGLGSMGL